MRTIVSGRLGSLGILAVAGAGLLASMPAHAQSNVFKLKGSIRDFSKTNPNFSVLPVGGNGHYAGNLDVALPADGKPVFVGGGYKVATQWKDQDGRVIAPHLFADSTTSGSAVVKLTHATTMPKKAAGAVDTYNSTLGPYGGTNVGPAPDYEVAAVMPEVVVPEALMALPNEGRFRAKKDATISQDMHCSSFDARGKVTISGTVNILCEGRFELDHKAQLMLAPGAKLNLYLMKGGLITHKAMVGDPAMPGNVRIFNLATEPTPKKSKKHHWNWKWHKAGGHHDDDDDNDEANENDDEDEWCDLKSKNKDKLVMSKAPKLRIRKGAMVHAHVVSPTALMAVSSQGALFGQFTGMGIRFGRKGNMHIDTAGGADACGREFNDIAGTKGVTSNGGIPSAGAFTYWYTDVLGQNLSMPHTINLTKTAQGVWQYLNDSFHPIDKKLLGNESQPHNNYFTFEASMQFVHRACSDTFFEFTGCDDVWVFIDHKLVLDRGGTVPNTTQFVNMDRLYLEDGKTYRLHFLHAQRNPLMSSFRLKTNLELIPEVDPPPLQFSAATD